jgi:hypothetical protein
MSGTDSGGYCRRRAALQPLSVVRWLVKFLIRTHSALRLALLLVSGPGELK